MFGSLSTYSRFDRSSESIFSTRTMKSHRKSSIEKTFKKKIIRPSYLCSISHCKLVEFSLVAGWWWRVPYIRRNLAPFFLIPLWQCPPWCCRFRHMSINPKKSQSEVVEKNYHMSSKPIGWCECRCQLSVFHCFLFWTDRVHETH